MDHECEGPRYHATRAELEARITEALADLEWWRRREALHAKGSPLWREATLEQTHILAVIQTARESLELVALDEEREARP